MKNTIKVFALMLCIAMIAGVFAACGASESNSTASDTEAAPATTPAATEPADTEPAADDDNVLVMGTNASFPPYEYVENNEIVGIDAEIAAAIAGKLGMELKIEDMAFDSIIPSVQSGLIDFGMAGMTVTDERKESVDFSISYANGVQVIIVPEGSDITGPDDLAAKKIGVQLATTGDIYATGDYGEDHVEEYATGNDAVVALTEGKVDAVIIDNEPAKAYVAANEGLTILDTTYVEEDYAIAVSKDTPELLDQINTALQELIDDGVVAEIVGKYISAD